MAGLHLPAQGYIEYPPPSSPRVLRKGSGDVQCDPHMKTYYRIQTGSVERGNHVPRTFLGTRLGKEGGVDTKSQKFIISEVYSYMVLQIYFSLEIFSKPFYFSPTLQDFNYAIKRAECKKKFCFDPVHFSLTQDSDSLKVPFFTVNPIFGCRNPKKAIFYQKERFLLILGT